jgi:hypothetical protein
MSDSSDWLDPEEFPFSEAELREALKGWEQIPALEHLPSAIARGLRECRLAREEARQALERGSKDLSVLNYPHCDVSWRGVGAYGRSQSSARRSSGLVLHCPPSKATE